MKKLLFWAVLIAAGFYAWESPELRAKYDDFVGGAFDKAKLNTQGIKSIDASYFLSQMKKTNSLDTFSKPEAMYVEELALSTENLIGFTREYCSGNNSFHPVFERQNLLKACRQAGSVVEMIKTSNVH